MKTFVQTDFSSLAHSLNRGLTPGSIFVERGGLLIDTRRYCDSTACFTMSDGSFMRQISSVFIVPFVVEHRIVNITISDYGVRLKCL